ncbi:unnamed protein product [Prunus armeniaca]
MTLLKCFRWLSGSESPLKCVKEGVENRFGGAACSISGCILEVPASLQVSKSVIHKLLNVFHAQCWSITLAPFAIRATLIDLLVGLQGSVLSFALPRRGVGGLRKFTLAISPVCSPLLGAIYVPLGFYRALASRGSAMQNNP